MGKVEPELEPKLNNFGSATLCFSTISSSGVEFPLETLVQR